MMTPYYYSVDKKEKQSMLISFLKSTKMYWLFTLFLLNLNFAQAQVVISEVFADGSFELRNTGTATVDISSYWICDFPRYRALSGLTIECGNLNLGANEEVVISDPSLFQSDDSELGLYTNSDFGSAAGLISYLEWGSTGHTRSGLAIGNNIWDGNAVAGFATGESLALNGTGTKAADWEVNTNPQKCAVAPPPASTSAARYQVTFNAAWSASTHPTDFPSNPHFSGLIGLTHTANTALFELGGTASQGIINMAETGSKNPLTAEIQAIIDGGQGQTLVSGGGVGTSPGSVSLEFAIENSHPLVSITTMIAPSPDWFVGVRDLNLFEGGNWVNSKTVEVANYDAGSDSGVSFASGNQATSPLGTIMMITDGPLVVNGAIPSMGTMTFTRVDAGACDADGGTLVGGPFTFCVDGTADNIPVDGITLSGNTGANNQWVVTDDQGNILGLPDSFTGPDFDAAGAGVCFVWNLAYEDGLTGLAMGANVDQLAGCFNLSNSVQVTRNQPAGGTLVGGPFTFCVDGTADNIPADGITLSGNTGGNSQWVVTDDQGNILGLPPSFTGPDFDAAGVGVCFVWHLSYEDGLTGLAMGANVDQLAGCYNLSNSVQVTREVCGGMCDAVGGTLTGGPYTFCVDGVKDTIPADGITLSGNTGTNNQWVVTDDQGNILGLPPTFSAPDFDAAGVGVCFVWNLAYEDGLTGLAMGANVDQLAGCYSLSNSVQVTRNQPAGGTLVGGPFTFCVDGTADNIPADGISLSGNTGGNSQWVVTDDQGNILGLPPSFTGPDFDAAGVGVCFVWHLSYEDGLTGLAMGANVDQLAGCYNLSNSVQVTREVCGGMCDAVGGTLTGGPYTFCVDGVKDTIPADGITLSGNTGTNNQWVVTDDQGNILGLPPTFSTPDFDAAGVGVCFVWNLAYEDGLTGLAMGANVDQLAGCFNLSNSVQVTRNQPAGGTLVGGPFTFCVDGTADNIPADGITLSGNTGGNSQWVVTDDQGNILGLPPSFTGPDFDAAGVGVCFVWHLSYEDGLTGLAMGANVDQLAGCYNLSNSVQVTREVCGDMCDAVGGTLTGGPYTFCVDGVKDTIPADGITLSGNTGTNNQWVVTDDQGNILGLPPTFSTPDFDAAGVGVCFVWNLAYEDGLTGLAMGANVDQLAGCFNLSNSVQVTRNQPAGGTLVGGPFTFCVDGTADNIPADGITLSGNTGGNSQWVVTDDQGNILGLPPSFTGPDFDAAGVGVCFVWHLSYEDGLTGLAMGANVDQLAGCYNLSNSVQVTREVCGDMCDAVGGTLTGGPYTFCVDGVKDTIPADGITLSGNTGTNNQWVVTDDQGNILGLPPTFSAPDFDAAGVGVCFVWNLAYEDGLTGLAMGANVDQLAGCYSLSNSVQVTREVCADPCTSPSDVVVDVLSNRKIRVDWEDVPNAARYLIEIRFTGRTRIVGRGLIRRSRVHIFAPSGRDYEFQIRTICADGSESPFTDWIPFSTPDNAVATAESRNAETFLADISIDEIATKELIAFPNPVSDLLQINYTITEETAVLELFHISGKKVTQQTLSNTTNNHELNMSSYSNGLYLMTITENGKAPITKRIVKGSLR